MAESSNGQDRSLSSFRWIRVRISPPSLKPCGVLFALNRIKTLAKAHTEEQIVLGNVEDKTLAGLD